MKKISRIIIIAFLLFPAGSVISQANTAKNLPQLLLRLDDNGMNHSVNLAIEKVAETGIPFSTSVMFACPWYQETVDILKKHPQISVGVHLTLNSEWKYYRWGPVLGKTAVPSLVDNVGYFRPSSEEFLKSNYKPDEVEKELSAQIERALNSGLKIAYVDYHMGTAVATPELRAIVEKLAKKYSLGISRYFGEQYTTMWPVSIESKKQVFMKHLDNLKPGVVNLVVLHVAVANPEMQALVDMNSDLMNTDDGKPKTSAHRQAELDMLLSPDFRNMVNKKFTLVTYIDLKNKGLEKMRSNALQELE